MSVTVYAPKASAFEPGKKWVCQTDDGIVIVRRINLRYQAEHTRSNGKRYRYAAQDTLSQAVAVVGNHTYEVPINAA